MIDNKSIVRVRIMGEEYTLRTEATASHTQAVADHVDKIIRAIMSSGTIVETHKAAILAALQITDELFRERQAGEAITGEIRQLASDIRPLLPPDRRAEDGSSG